MNRASSETKICAMCVLSLPKVVSYETQVIKNRTWFEFHNSRTPDNRQATESKANTQSHCITILLKVRGHSRIMKLDHSNDITSDTWKGPENTRGSKRSYCLCCASPNSYVTTPMLCRKHSLNVVTLEAE